MSEQKCPNCGKEMRGSDDAAAPEMAELLERIALHGPPMSYFDGGSVGEYVCCGNMDFGEHKPECWFAEARALLARIKGEKR